MVPTITAKTYVTQHVCLFQPKITRELNNQNNNKNDNIYLKNTVCQFSACRVDEMIRNATTLFTLEPKGYHKRACHISTLPGPIRWGYAHLAHRVSMWGLRCVLLTHSLDDGKHCHHQPLTAPSTNSRLTGNQLKMVETEKEKWGEWQRKGGALDKWKKFLKQKMISL